MMQHGRVFFTFSVALCLVALVSALAGAQTPVDPSLKNPFAGNTEAIAFGKTTFEAVCAGYYHGHRGGEEGRAVSKFI